MNRILTLLGIAALALACGQQSVAAQTLRASTTVSAPIVTIGDLVLDAGAQAAAPIFEAPDPGQTGQVSARMILDAARVHGLVVDAQGLSTVSVSRASRRITQEIIAPLVRAEIAKRLQIADPDTISVSLDDAMKAIDLPSEADGALVLTDLSWRAETGAFDAALLVSRRDGQLERRAFRGTAMETVPVVVLSQAADRGAPLQAGDLEIIHKPKSETRGDLVSDMEAAIGMELRRSVREGVPLRNADLIEPQVVRRGKPVTITLETGSLTLTAVGQAMRDAVRGEIVQVMNLQSKRVLQAIATGPDQVTVSVGRALASTAR